MTLAGSSRVRSTSKITSAYSKTMSTRAQAKQRLVTKSAEVEKPVATEPLEEMATKAEVKQLEVRLTADLDVLAGRMLDLAERMEVIARRRQRHGVPHASAARYRSTKELQAELQPSREDVHVEALAGIPQGELGDLIRSEVMLKTLDDACSSVG